MPNSESFEDAHLLGLNNFNMPRIYKNARSMYVHIVYLILLKKGTFQSHPDMGVSLRERYRYKSASNIEWELKTDIDNQIQTYLPGLVNVKIEVAVPATNMLTILIDTGNGVFALTYNQKTDQIKQVDYDNFPMSDL